MTTEGSVFAVALASATKAEPRAAEIAYQPDAPANDLVGRARLILRGAAASVEEISELALRLHAFRRYDDARRLAAKVETRADATPDMRLSCSIQRALSTSFDASLPVDARVDDALAILKREASLDTESASLATLSTAGFLYHRRWEHNYAREDLEWALHYLTRAYDLGEKAGPLNAWVEAAVGAAFTEDLIARAEASVVPGSPGRGAVDPRANVRRAHVVTVLAAEPTPPADAGPWRFSRASRRFLLLMYQAEAHAVVGHVDVPPKLVGEALAIPGIPHAMLVTTVRRILTLVGIRPDLDAARARIEALLAPLLGPGRPLPRPGRRYKVGLALSGGGFRASLFHIGVLARLAELGLLSKVEIISCVSGGSIVGAHYYLELRRLLEDRFDGELTRDDYIGLVARLQKSFLAGVQQNLRMRILTNPLHVYRMILSDHFTRTDRAGDLFDEHLFARVAGPAVHGLSELGVRPKNESAGFNPIDDNWARLHKVPQLILNATTLNTGNGWQFTVDSMGESPSGLDAVIDASDRLRRVPYADAPAAHNGFRLGRAVAASACVPGVFEPIRLEGLYPDRVIRLVDGGVYDNQGTAALLDQGCDALLVSDGCGQMDSMANPGDGVLGVSARSNDILMRRVRGAQYRELAARRRVSQIRGLMFVHMRMGLESTPVDWIGCKEGGLDDDPGGEQPGDLTAYGVRKDIQWLLSELRTDLDSFCDAEAFALMTSGYKMVEHALAPGAVEHGLASLIDDPPARRVDWEFLQIEEHMRHPRSDDRLKRILKVGSQNTMKVLDLLPWLRLVAVVLAVAVLVACACLFDEDLPGPTLLDVAGFFGRVQEGRFKGETVVIIPMLMALGVLLWAVKPLRRPVRFVARLTAGAFGALVIALSTIWSLLLFDRFYLWYGSIKRFEKRPGPPGP